IGHRLPSAHGRASYGTLKARWTTAFAAPLAAVRQGRRPPSASGRAGGVEHDTGTGMRAGRRILIVDDDGALRPTLAEQLELNAEFVAVACDTAARAVELVEGQRFDAILLDVGLPDLDGRELCRLLRRGGIQVPIIMLTGADSETDTVLGLDSGADDY